MYKIVIQGVCPVARGLLNITSRMRKWQHPPSVVKYMYGPK